MLGILGGMGPLATVEFMRKLILRSSKAGESHCLPMLAVVDGRIPDRSAAIVNREARSPLPDMIRCIRLIEAQSVELIVIPCNSAHYWIEALRQASCKPILSMIDVVSTHTIELLKTRDAPRRVGVLGTRGLLSSGLYQQRLRCLADVEFVDTGECGQGLVDQLIIDVKCGDLVQARTCAERLLSYIDSFEADAWILGCTELPIAFEGIGTSKALLIDCADILAAAVLEALRQPLTCDAAEENAARSLSVILAEP